MTRRSAILAVLVGVGGQEMVSSDTTRFLDVTIPETFVKEFGHVVMCDPPAAKDSAKVCMSPDKLVPLDYAIVVHYKNRTVRITPDELMDALEGVSHE